MIKRILERFRKPRHESAAMLAAKQEYVQAGAEIGDALSQVYMGRCLGFEELLERWHRAEDAYGAHGLRTISLDDFIEFGGYGTPIDSLLDRKRAEGEAPISHYARFKEIEEYVFSQPNPVARAFETGEIVVGTYFVPSTKRDDDPQ